MFLFCLLLLSIVLGIALGQTKVFTPAGWNSLILWEFRIPRVFFAGLNGAILALAGVLYQITLRNPMADGFTTGAASAAAFGGCLALIFWGTLWAVSFCAFICAVLGINIVRFVAARAGGFSSGSVSGSVTIILAGIALSVIAASGVSFLKYFFEESMSTMVFWLMGGLSRGTWLHVGILAIILTALLGILTLKKQEIAVLFLDDQSALTTGVDVYRMREFLFIVTTLLVALSVSFCGIISFIGLMVPHAVRIIWGHDINTQLWCSSLMGAAALILFDLLARTVLPQGGELPVGIITSLCGGLFFCGLLVRKGGTVWQS